MLRALLQRHSVVLLDATSTTRKRREEIERVVQPIAVVYHVIETDVETCIQRAISKDDPDMWAEVIQGMADNFEGLQAQETEWSAGE